MQKLTGARLAIAVVLGGVAAGAATSLYLRSRAASQAALTPPIAARAKAPDRSQLLPSVDLYSESEVRRELRRMKITPYDDPGFAFEILVPATWRSLDFGIDEDAFEHDTEAPVPMAVLGPEDEHSTVLEISYLRAPRDEPLGQLLARYVAALEGVAVARQSGTFNGRPVEEALVRRLRPPHGEVLTRLTLSRDEEIVFIVAGTALRDHYAHWRRALGAAAVSFTPARVPTP